MAMTVAVFIPFSHLGRTRTDILPVFVDQFFEMAMLFLERVFGCLVHE